MTTALVSAADVGVYATAFLSVFAVVGLMVRYVLLPYLRDQVVKPVRETHRQVTQNRHQNREPTVVDRIDDVGTKVDDLADRIEQLGAEATAASVIARAAARSANAAHRKLDTHKGWASEEVHRVWTAIREQERNQHDPG